MLALKNAVVHTGEGVLSGYDVLVSKDVVHDLVPSGQCPSGCAQADLAGLHLAPGFVDLQINGCGGTTFSEDISEQTLATMLATSLATGATSILPTLTSSPDQAMLAAMRAVAAFNRRHPDSGVLGLHMEGPYLNPDRPGIHDPGQIRPPAPDMLARMAEAGPEVVRLATMAPETAKPAHVRLLTDAGIRVFAGHSLAGFGRAMEAFETGFTGVTHLFNAMLPISAREPGLAGAALAHPRARAGIIADGAHVAWANVIMAKRLLGRRLFLATDASAPMGANIKSFKMAGKTLRASGGRCLDDSGTLGGSLLGLDKAVANMVRHGETDLDEALRMASLYPAACLGLDKELGRIAPGYKADLVAFTEHLEIKMVYKNGIQAVPGPEG